MTDKQDHDSGSLHFNRPLQAYHGEKPPAPDWFKWALDVESEDGEVEVANARIRYTAWGDVGKPGLCFIHGGMAHREWWRPFVPFFSEQYRVAALDLSGMGDSDWRAQYNTDSYIDEVMAVVKAAELDAVNRPLLLGHSFGGWITMACVQREGEQLGGAVIMDPPIQPPTPDEGYRFTVSGDEPEGAVKGQRFYTDLTGALSRFRLVPEQPCDQHYLLDHIARHGLIKAPMGDKGTGYTWKFDPVGGTKYEISINSNLPVAAHCPLAYIYGSRSLFANSPGFEHLASLVKGRSPFIVMPEAHHHMMLDQPLSFIAVLRALLACWPLRVGH